jgi:ribosomal protein S18 acetylase RimI-like enzyme
MPLGSVTWKARSPHSSTVSGMVMATPSDSLRLQPRQLALEVIDHKGQDQAGGVAVPLVRRKAGQASTKEDHVHAAVRPRQRGEAIGRHLFDKAEVIPQEVRRSADVIDVE